MLGKQLGKILGRILRGTKGRYPSKRPVKKKEKIVWDSSHLEGHVPGKTRGLGRGLSDIPVQKSKRGLEVATARRRVSKPPKATKPPKVSKATSHLHTKAMLSRPAATAPTPAATGSASTYARQLNTINTVGWVVGAFGVGMGVGGALTTWQQNERKRVEKRRIEANKKFLRDYGEGIRRRGISKGQAMSSAFSPPPLATYDLRFGDKKQLLKSAFGKRGKK
jgi:hypothetical protein